MTTDQLFKALPRDLQWEILETFVGTHVVRNGKLMRKMTGDVQEELASKMGADLGDLWIKQPQLYITLGTFVKGKNINFNSNVVLRRDFKMDIYLWENWHNREITYMYYRYNYTSECYRYDMKNGLSLPPFIKHNYPSYEYTDKKLGRPCKKMTLYNPRKYFKKRLEEEAEQLANM
jgi:hypothetical protein